MVPAPPHYKHGPISNDVSINRRDPVLFLSTGQFLLAQAVGGTKTSMEVHAFLLY